jgi:hypothetical protein
MNKEFVPYQQSLDMKELGFDEPCLIKDTEQGEECAIYYAHDNGKPTYSEAFRWFRDKHDLVHRIDKDGGWWVCAILDLYDEKEQGTIEIYLENCYPNTYEEAELECIKKLIEIVKNK